MEWQPIETAPKDFSSVIDGWNGSRVPDMVWGRPTYDDGDICWCSQEYEQNYGWILERVTGLTHWMPLPEPPQDFSGDIGHE